MLEVIEQSLKNLRREGVRTFLTLIGIVIGIAAIVALLSIGSGLTIAFEEQFEGIGSNMVFASPGDALSMQQSTDLKISQKDVENVKNIRNVKTVIAEYAGAGAIHFDNETRSAIFFSVDEEGYDFFKNEDFVELIEGRWIEPNESTGIMINETLAKDAFDKEINLRKQLDISGKNFKVVGIFKFGSGASTFMGGSGIVFSTINGYDRVFPEKEIAEIMIKTETTESAPQVAEDVKEYFEDKYGKRSITVLTSDQAIEQLNSVLSLLTIVIAGIAGISLVVGGIGIMNAMITSVIERTKEIGLYKALGASNKKILSIFILEAGFIGLLGGIIGCALGFSLAGIIGIVGSSAGLPLRAVITPELVIGGLAFSMIVGILSGLYPAIKASQLDPVEAIRFD